MWHLEQYRATGTWPPLIFQAQLDRPVQGWHVCAKGHWLEGRWWQLRVPYLGSMDPEECYIRGNDLVVDYPLMPDRHLKPQIYWRAVSEIGSCWNGMELIVSMQTDSLDSDSSVVIRTHGLWDTIQYLDADRELRDVNGSRARFGPSVALPVLVLRGKYGTYIETVYPGDFVSVKVARVHDRVSVSWQLFAERLEKGVIRRTRLQGVFGWDHSSREAIVEAFEAFCSAPLPLTV